MGDVALLRADRVSVTYGAFTALSDVSLSFGAGEFISIVGPNGAGKSTLVNVLTGLVRPTEGEVRFKDADIAGRGPVWLTRCGMARSFQLVSIFPDLSVWESIAVGVIARTGRGRRWLANVRRDPMLASEVEAIAALFRLSSRLNERCRTLSQGDKKLLDVASAFAMRPEVILLDEPTSGVSTADKHAVMKVMVDAARLMGISSIIQVEHDMDLVFGYSDRIVALHQGRVVADTTPAGLRGNAEVLAKVVGKARP